MYENLLKPGETVKELDTSGWVVLSNFLNPDDEIIIDCANRYPMLFDIPVRAKVVHISSNNLLKIDLQTPNAKDSNGSEWKLGEQFGYFDIMFMSKKIIPQQLPGEVGLESIY